MKKFIVIFFSIMIILGIGTIGYSFADQVPPWVKNTAKWYGDGLISEKEFLNAIKYLINNGILNLDEQPTIKVYDNLSNEELIEKGIDQLDLKNNLEALEFFNQVLERDSDNVKALTDKGIVLARQGNFKDAKSLFDKAIELSEKKGNVDYRIIANTGIILSIYGDQTQANAYFERVLENKENVRQETLVAVLVNKGVLLLQQGKNQESIEYFDQALEIEPTRIGALVNKANALQNMKQLDEAYELFKKAHQLSKDPLSWKPTLIIIR